jgi:translation elongation factor EF-Ts
MADIPAQLVKQLRDRTGAGMMECKSALIEAGGDIGNAEIILRKRGIASAHKKATRVTKQGLIGSYIHSGGQLGVLVEVNCESDFVARNAVFQELVHDIAMHIAAADPKYIRKDQPLTQEEIAAANGYAPQVHRPTPPPIPRSNAPDNTQGQSDIWQMPLDQLRKQALSAQTGGRYWRGSTSGNQCFWLLLSPCSFLA